MDLTELFGRDLLGGRFEIHWWMSRLSPGQCQEVFDNGMIVNLPCRGKDSGVLARIVNRLLSWSCDVITIGRYALSRRVSLIQVRDKYLSAVAALVFGAISGIPIIYWCSYPFPEHDLDHYRDSGGMRMVWTWLRGTIGMWILYKVVMPRVCHIFVQSDRMLDTLVEKGVLRERMTSVPMAVPQRLFDWAATSPISVKTRRIVYIGTLSRARRLECLIDSWRLVAEKFPDAKLLMVGDGDFPHEKLFLERYAKELGLDQSIEFTGFVPLEYAWQLAASGEVCVSPIFRSRVLDVGSPTKLLEYMAMGKPVVANTHPEQRDIIEESGAGLCVEWSAAAFSNAIIWMLENPEQARVMGLRGPQWIKDNRLYPALAEKVWKVYERLLDVGS